MQRSLENKCEQILNAEFLHPPWQHTNNLTRSQFSHINTILAVGRFINQSRPTKNNVVYLSGDANTLNVGFVWDILLMGGQINEQLNK